MDSFAFVSVLGGGVRSFFFRTKEEKDRKRTKSEKKRKCDGEMVGR